MTTPAVRRLFSDTAAAFDQRLFAEPATNGELMADLTTGREMLYRLKLRSIPGAVVEIKAINDDLPASRPET